MSHVDTVGSWPALPLAEWKDTYTTLHRWTQIVGKTRLRFEPMQNHWWQTALYVTTRGIGTSPMWDGARSFDVEFDFIDHVLAVRTSDDMKRTIPLEPRTVADFYSEYLAVLRSLGIEARLWPVPMELTDTLRFDQDRIHESYDPDAAHRCWRALADTDRVLKRFRGRFLGKSSPSHFWWGGFDIACTRFSGKRAPTHPGGIPNCPDYVTQEAYSHECISAGWWPGSVGVKEEPAFYAYAYPEPPGYPTAAIAPAEAYYDLGFHDWILPYEAVRNSADPDATLLQFCQSTYSAAADLGHWDRAALERPSDRSQVV
ncbi:MAG: DUF5996 family protein [Gemmatimonadales bacterium]